MEGERCYVLCSSLERWVIINADHCELAWSGSRWVPHQYGLPIGLAQISNLETRDSATRYAKDFGFEVVGELVGDY